MFAYCNNNPVMYSDPEGMLFLVDDAFWALVGVFGITVISVLLSPPVQKLIYDFIDGAVTSFSDLVQQVGYILEAKGKQNIRDSGLIDVSDEEVVQRAHDNSLSSSERERYKREEKARGLRNRQKRKSIYDVHCKE